jgi:hypothetical protein
MRGFIDRIVDGVAVLLLEGGGRAYVPAPALPPGLAEGGLVEVTFSPLELAPGPDGVEAAAELIERLKAGEHRHG